MTPDVQSLINASTGYMNSEERASIIGKTIYSRDGSCKGIVRMASRRRCAVCGMHTCLIVDWSDGDVTKPCTAGIETLPDGTLKIQ